MDRPREMLLAVGLTCAALLPFVDKPYHIDDPFFIYQARQILRDPLRPFDFDVNWFGTVKPMWALTRNPALNSYYMAAVIGLFGENEVVMHLAFLPFAVVSVMLMHALGARFTRQPVAAALMLLASPAFLVSATVVMADIPLLACYLGAILAFIHGEERKDWRLLALCGLLTGLATMLKYVGLSLIPLLAVYWWLRRPRMWGELAVFLIPLAMLGAWSLMGMAHHGRTNIGASVGYLIANRFQLIALGPQLFACLTFTGGCLLGLVFMLPWAMRKGRWPALAAAAGTAACGLATGTGEWSRLGTFHAGLALAMVLVGALLICLAIAEALKQRSADDVFLLVWLVGQLLFVAVVNWSTAARFALLAFPPLILLVVRRVERVADVQVSRFTVVERRGDWRLRVASGVGVGCSLALSLALAYADYLHAQACAVFPERMKALVSEGKEGVWFSGHWGFQYYMEQEGFKPIDFDNVAGKPGDFFVTPTFGDHVGFSPDLRPRLRPVEGESRVYEGIGLHVMNPAANAGFYSHRCGLLPLSIAPGVPSEVFAVFRLERGER